MRGYAGDARDARDAFHLFREKGGAKKLPTNLLLDGHIEKILFIG